MPFLLAYQDAVNGTAARRGWHVRLAMGESKGPFFLDQRAHALQYDTLLRDFGACSKLAGIQPFTAYGLRRLYASGLAALLPMDVAARAGGWLNHVVFGKHYARSLLDWQPMLLKPEPSTSLDDDLPWAPHGVEGQKEFTRGLA